MKKFLYAAFIFNILSMQLLSNALGATSLYYYSNSASLTHLPSGQVTGEEVLLSKTLDKENSTIIEIACIKAPGQHSFLSPIYMKVTGNTVDIADTRDINHPDKVSGTGTLMGSDWNWTFLKFSMVYLPSSTKIEDSNFVTANQLIGRKQIFGANGMPIMLYELEMNLITQDAYQSHYSDMECPQQVAQ